VGRAHRGLLVGNIDDYYFWVAAKVDGECERSGEETDVRERVR
jgi:hypothetical protein